MIKITKGKNDWLEIFWGGLWIISVVFLFLFVNFFSKNDFIFGVLFLVLTIISIVLLTIIGRRLNKRI